tara:strand:+ start:434 stop:1180 length:747 start_codon:yes stop_codon:yes gene_type:complete
MLNQDLKNKLINLVEELGEKAEIIKKGNSKVTFKQDNSPLSEADILINKELNRFILETKITNIISEENKEIDYTLRKNWDLYWLIDPIDGTKEFIKKGSDYTINIALCSRNSPIFSIVYAPARAEMFTAEKNNGAFKNSKKITINTNRGRSLNIVASKSHMNFETTEYINRIKEKYKVNLLQFGSSLKICKVAEGVADIYPRFGPTMEWDTCAADLIVSEAGGRIFDVNNKQLIYNKPNLLNPFFIVS